MTPHTTRTTSGRAPEPGAQAATVPPAGSTTDAMTADATTPSPAFAKTAKPIIDPTITPTATSASAPAAVPTDTNTGAAGHFGIKLMLPLMLGSILNPINSSMISTAMVQINGAFHASVAQTVWLIAGLYLACAIAQPTMGRIADLYGARRVYLAGVALVGVAGLAGPWAPSLAALIWIRVALGVGTSSAYPSAMKILRTQAARHGTAPPRMALGVLSFASVSISAVGPTLGGVLSGTFGWQAIFLVNVPLALLGLLLTWRWIPADAPRQAGPANLLAEFDFIGMGLFAGSITLLLLFLMRLAQPNWLLLAPAVAMGALLVWHSRRRAQPFIDVRMLARNRALRGTYLRAMLISMMTYCMLYGFAQWLESAAGYSSTQAGLITLPMSIVAAVCSLLGARTKGVRTPMLIGLVSLVAGGVALHFVTSATPVPLLAIAAVLFGIPQGLCSIAIQASVYLQAPAAEIGAAAGLQRTAQYVGAIAASALLGMLYGARASDHGLHAVALVMAALSALLLLATVFDRSVPTESAS